MTANFFSRLWCAGFQQTLRKFVCQILMLWSMAAGTAMAIPQPLVTIRTPVSGALIPAISSTAVVYLEGVADATAVFGTSAGAVELWEGGQLLATNPSTGAALRSASFRVPFAMGKHHVEYRMWGDTATPASDFVDFEVVPALPPSVTLTAPVDGAVVALTGNTSPLIVSGVAAGQNTTITKLEVLDGATVIYSSAAATLNNLAIPGQALGAHSVWLRATDSAGAVVLTDPVTVTLTATLPTATITAPLQGRTYGTLTGSAPVTVTGTAAGTTGASVKKIELWEGATSLGVVTIESSPHITKSFAMGPHHIEWRVTDGRGGVTSAFADFEVVPAIPPSVALTAPVDGAVIAMTGNTFPITVSGSAIAQNTTVTKMEVLDGTTVIYSGTASSLSNVSTTALVIGIHRLKLRATDSVGAVVTTDPVTITLTGTPPDAVITAPLKGSSLAVGTPAGTGTVVISGTAFGTSGATIKTVELWEGNSKLAATLPTNKVDFAQVFTLGAHTVEFRAIDVRGTATSRFVDFTVVPGVVPAVVMTSPKDGDVLPMKSDLLSILVTGSSTPVAPAKIAKLEILADGNAIYATSAASITNIGGLALVMGPHTMQLKATDSLGTIGYSNLINVTLTGTPPTSSITLPVQGGRYGTVTGSASLTVTGTAAGTTGASVKKIELFEDDTSLGVVTIESSPHITKTFAMGPHRIEWRVTDGRAMTTSSFADFSVVQATAPTVILTSPVNGAAVPMTGVAFAVPVSGSAIASGATNDIPKIAKMEVLDGGKVVYTGTSATLTNAPTSGLAIGLHTLQLRATDGVGAIGLSDPVSIILTGTPPTVAVTAPVQGDSYGAVGGSVTIAVTGNSYGTTGATISKIELWEGGTLLGTAATANVATFSKPFTLGAHKIEWRATDTRGLVASTFVDFNVVPGIAPTATVTSPTEGASLAMAGNLLSINVSGFATGAYHAQISKVVIFDGDKNVATATGTGPYANVPTLGLAIGPHTIRLQAFDNLGNVAYSDPVNITLTGTPPTAAFTAPANGITLPTSTSSANLTITGSGNGTTGATLAKNELWEGTTLLGTATTAAATFTKPFNIGAHTLEWRTTDARGQVASSYLNFSVVAGPAPTAIISAPLDGASYPLVTGTTVAVPVTAGVAVAAPATVNKLEILDGTAIKYTLANATLANTSIALTAGEHALQARVTDSAGKIVVGNIVNVMVTVPSTTATITAPLTGAEYTAAATGKASVTVAGSAKPFNAATISTLELIEGTTVLQTVKTATLSAAVAFAPGEHSIQLRATDSTSKQVLSDPIVFTVYPQLTGNAAEFADQSVPASMRSGQPYSVTVKMLNTGTVTWTEAAQFRLGAVNPNDNRTWTSTGRAYLAASTAPGAIATFTIPVTAPQKAGTYNFQWRMLQESTGGFGDTTDNLAIQVVDGSGPSAALTVTPSNSRMTGSTPVTLSLSASAAESGRKISRLDVFMDKGAGYAATALKSLTGTTDSLKLDFTTTAAAGVYRFKARSTDDLGAQTDSEAVIVSVADSTVLGTVTGIRLDRDNKPILVGWLCKAGATTPLAYEILLDAPTPVAGGTRLATGIANVGGDADDAVAQAACGTLGVSHGFAVDLSGSSAPVARKMALRTAVAMPDDDAPYTNIYAGRAIYVHALDVGTAPAVLPCADNSCTIPGSLRITLAAPADGSTMLGPDTLFVRTAVSGTTDPVDEVAISLDGNWVTAQPDTGTNAYYANFANVQPRAASYILQARVRQGNTTVYSAQNLLKVDQKPLPTLAMTSPTSSASVLVGTPVSLSAVLGGATAGVTSVNFYVNGKFVRSGVSSGDDWSAQWVPIAAGSYTIHAQVYDASGMQMAQSAAISLGVTAPSGGNTLIPVNVTVPSLSGDVAGTLPGDLNVGEDGAATYAIPIVVPPGTAGMMPELSLNYSSNGSNAMAGLGWSLGGLSTLHRCPKTIAQDGVAGRISFDSADRLCLDGQRLLLANGSNPGADQNSRDLAYWAAAAQYRTEIEGFSRVSRYSNGYKVEDKNGRIRYYGIDGGNFIAAQGRSDGQRLLWALDRVEDRSGNYMTLGYSLDSASGEYVPAQINYGGNSNAKTTPDLAVRFLYEGRNDAQTQYMGGSRNDLRRRLTHIQTFTDTAADGTGGTAARDYTIQYVESASSGRSLVDSVQVCAFNRSSGQNECMPATHFSWGSGGQPKLIQKTRFNLNVLADGEEIAIKTYVGDFKGSGTSSVIVPAQKCVAASCFVRVFYGDLSGNDGQGYGWTSHMDMSQLQGKYQEMLTGDLNGDGRDDLVLLDPGGRGWAYCLSTPTTDAAPAFAQCQAGGTLPPIRNNVGNSDLPTLVSLDNSGRSQLLYFDDANQAHVCGYNGAISCNVMPTSVPSGVLTTGFMPLELSKQGQSDFYVVNNPIINGPQVPQPANVTVCRTVKGTLQCDVISAPSSNVSAGAGAGDLNGDGLTDFFFADNDGSKLCLSSETGVSCRLMATRAAAAPTTGSVGFGYYFAGVSDMVGDGVNRYWAYSAGNNTRPDVLCRLADTTEVCQQVDVSALPQETMDFITQRETSSRPFYIDRSGVPASLNCVSTPDYVNSSYLQSCWITSLAASSNQDRLISVTNGIGNEAQAGYAKGDDTDAYSRYAAVDGVAIVPAYPQTASVPGSIVKTLRRSNGQGGWLASAYSYAGAMSDQTGRGSLGFTINVVVDIPSGIVTESVHAQSFPFVGMDIRSRQVKDGCMLQSTANTFDQQVVSLSSGAMTYFPYLKSANSLRRDLDPDCSDMGSVAVVNQYNDGWGNPNVQTTTSTGGGRSFVQNVSTDFQVANQLTFLAGLPTKVVTTRTDENTVVRTVTYSYNATTGLRTTETVEPDNVALKVLTTYDRSGNVFGLVNKVTQSWTDPACKSAGWPETGCVEAKSRIVSNTTFDAKGHFPVTVANGLAQIQTLTFDAASGAKTGSRDPNLLQTLWQLDGYGRVQVEIQPDGNETRSSLKRCGSDCPFNATTVAVAEQFHGNDRIAVPQLTYLDSAGHTVRKQTWGFDGTPVVVDQRYDDRGRPAAVDQPRFAAANAYLASRQEYDDLNRVIKSVSVDEAGNELSAITNYHGLIIEQTNPKQQTRTERRDVLGQLRAVLDSGEPRGTTSFTYDAFGGLKTTTDPNGNVITVDYDVSGRKIGLHDPDLGWIQYNLNPLGQVYVQISPEQAAAGKKTWTAYDVLGRMTARYEPDLESHWIFDTAAKGIGQLAEADIGKGSLSDYRRTHSYDDFGRPGSTAQYMADSNGQYTLFIATPDYDVWGRLASQTYLHSGDSAKVFTQRYNAYGYLSRIQRGDLALWDVAGQDAANRVTSAVLGNGLTQNRSFNPYTSRLEHAELITGSSVERLKETYLYDVLGNVTTRGQFWNGDGFLETFEYDALNRLKTSQVAGKGQQVYTYDAAGNIVTKTGLGTYRYPAQGNNAIQPHAVQGIDGVSGTYSYDKNGNLLVGGGRSYTWTSFDMPLTINKGSSASARFYYGPEHQRINQARSDGMVTYAGAQEVEPAPGGGVRLKTYWPNGLGVEIDQNGTTQVNWTHLDRLGSPVAMTGEDGAIRADGKLEYDAWGKRRSVVDNNATDDSIDGKIDNRGFTGHEMLDQLDLVHMNGRVYDPLIGKFTSGDPLVSDPVNGQSYNRYAYVLNNPTNSTDPTGFEEEPAPELKRPATTLQGGGDWQVVYAAPGSSAGFSLVKPEKGAIGTAATRPDLSASSGGGHGGCCGGDFDSANSGDSGDKKYVQTTTQRVDPISNIPIVTTNAREAVNHADKVMGAFIGIVFEEAMAVVPQLQPLRMLRDLSKGPTGSYTNTHASGKTYHGKGNWKRSQDSAREKAEEYNDPHVSTDWTPASDKTEALKDEARRLRGDDNGGPRGHDNPNNYNKRASPGEKYLQRDGE